MSRRERAPSAGIALVGMACEYPDIHSPSDLWETVLTRRRAFRRFPEERLRLDDYQSDERLPDTTYGRQGAFLQGYSFDRVGFRVAGRTFRSADFAHWLALDVASRALDDAGFPEGDGLDREMTGVLLGNTLTGEFSRANLMRLRWPYVRHVVGANLLAEGWSEEQASAFLGRLEGAYKHPFPAMTEESLAGGLSNTIAGRVCNYFDFKGGGFTVDGACASSLLATCQACSALVAGDLDLALAGGVDLSLDPFELVGFSMTGALAPEEMRVYDKRSAGFFPGEGCGFVVLMREEDAIAQRRRIYAVIRGWGVSSDGSGGITRPEVEGQGLAISRAYRRAGFGIDTVGYFEGHGTGTGVGDATELTALTRARRAADPAAPPVPVGTIKGNFGHTKAAAGVAGLIKATQVLVNHLIPPITGCETPHDLLEEENPALRVPFEAELWPRDRPVRAGVSAMGFGGINTHLVLEGEPVERRRKITARERVLLATPQDAELFFLRAAGSEALAERVRGLAELAARLSRAELTDLAAVLAGSPEIGFLRAAVVASTPAELAERLERLGEWLAAGVESRLDARRGVFLGGGSRTARIGFLFPGQGSPSRREAGGLGRRFEAVADFYDEVELPAGDNAVDTAIAQPAIVAAATAGLLALEEMGVKAEYAVGHSLGELVALYWAGSLGEEALLALATARGRAMSDLGDASGTMASVSASADTVRDLAGADEVSLAALNSPHRTVISGSKDAVDGVLRAAAMSDLQATRLRVSHAFHSPLVAAAAPQLEKALAGERLLPPRRTVVSTVTGRELSAEDDLAALLVEQVTSPVRFTEAVESLRDAVDLWIEVGPGRTLTGLLDDFDLAPAIALDVGGDSLKGLLEAVGAAFCLGAPVNPEVLFASRFSRPFDPAAPLEFLANPCEVFEDRADGVEKAEVPADPVAAVPAAEAKESPAEDLAPIDLVRELVAHRAELPAAAIAADSRLLSDLHLNSISVGQLVVEAAQQLGRQSPASPNDFADATVAEVTEALLEGEERADGADAAVEEGPPPGVGSWVAAFEQIWQEKALPAGGGDLGGADGGWTVVAPPGHPLAAALGAALTEGGGVALCLPAELDEEAVDLYLEAARPLLDGEAAPRFLVVHAGGGGGGFARTLHLEHPEVHTAVVDVPFEDPRAAGWAADEALAANGYGEARWDADGRRYVPHLEHRPLAATSAVGVSGAETEPLGSADVLLVSGGGKGIASECALDLARRSGARLILLGRSRPEESPELAANLDRFRAAGVEFRYVSADVNDPAAVALAVAGAQEVVGSVTGLLHGAGLNTPRLLAALDGKAFRRTLAPKIGGLHNILAAIEPERLRLLVTFGSIIARMGLRGEADYATANEWLTLETERFAREHPNCRCLALEWSVWSGVGMGERLGRVEGLIREGITPIPPELGVDLLARWIASPEAPVAMVVGSRFGTPPTMRLAHRELPLLRFLESPRVVFPGVELVVDSEISGDSDPYLSDHVFRGERLLPAVIGLEAMAQAATALLGREDLPVFEQAEFRRPVVIAEGQRVRLRVAALARSDGRVEVVLRSSGSDFKTDDFRALCRFSEQPGEPPPADFIASPSTANGTTLPLEAEGDLYGPLFFHTGRFRRIQGYRELSARSCVADIPGNGAVPWFGRYLPPRMLLGDAAVRDALLHGIQVCVPHATILPVGVDRIEVCELSSKADYVLSARERRREGNTFVYDVELSDGSGRLCERWSGLRLQVVDRNRPPASWKTPILASYVERRLQELLPEDGAKPAVAIRQRESAERQEDSDRTIRATLPEGGEAEVHRRPDGKPEANGGADGVEVSVSHAGDLVLAVSGEAPLGCDAEAVAGREAAMWSDLLGADRFSLAERIASEHDESADRAATRVWAAGECLKKAGTPHDAPLVLDQVTDDGWLLLRSGSLVIGTLVAPVDGFADGLALAVLAGSR
ncbi:MAG: SDR family NAD(P)-dependent oxidoreductase [Acidobacteriota bacterium]